MPEAKSWTRELGVVYEKDEISTQVESFVYSGRRKLVVRRKNIQKVADLTVKETEDTVCR